MAEIRLSKLIKQFNIGLDTLVDFLNSKGAGIEDANPNMKVSDEFVPELHKKFGKDLELKEAAEKVDVKLTEILDKAAKKPEAEEDEFEPERVTVIKSNNLSRKPEPAPAPAPEPVKEPEPEPVPEPVPEPEPEPVVEQEPLVEVAEDASFAAENIADAPQESSPPLLSLNRWPSLNLKKSPKLLQKKKHPPRPQRKLLPKRPRPPSRWWAR